jgi:hypothetical protein
VFTADRKYGVSADNTGYYSLAVEKGEITVLCSFTGYRTVERTVSMRESTVVDFELETDNEVLEAA